MPQNKFAEIITSTRKRRGISQKQAALELGISQSLLSHYENGARECSLDFLVRLSDYYGVSCDYLLGHSTAKTSRSASAQRQRSFTRTLEALMLLVERTDDEKLLRELSAYLKSSIYRCFKLFDGICPGLYFEGDRLSGSFAESVGEVHFTKALKEAENLKDVEISLHASSLEYPLRLINEVETELYEKELI